MLNDKSLNIINLASESSNLYADLRHHMPGPELSCSTHRKVMAIEQLEFLKQADVAPAARPAYELEVSFYKAMATLDNPDQATRHLKTHIVSVMAVLGIRQMADPYTVFQVRSRDVKAPDELVQLRKTNARLVQENKDLTASLLDHAVLQFDASVDTLKDKANVENIKSISQALYKRFGETLNKLANDIAEALELNTDNPDSVFLLGLLQRVQDVIHGEVLTPWDDEITGEGHGHRLEALAASLVEQQTPNMSS